MTVARIYTVYLDSFETFCPLVQAPANHTTSNETQTNLAGAQSDDSCLY